MKTHIREDVAAVLTDMEEQGVRAIGPGAVVHDVIASFGVHDDQDPRYQQAMIEHVHRVVNQMINSYKVQPETDDQVDGQLVLPGYQRLQRRYLVKEDGATFAVQVQALKDDQLYEKAAELRNMGEGCFLHADEIERYVEERNAEATG